MLSPTLKKGNHVRWWIKPISLIVQFFTMNIISYHIYTFKYMQLKNIYTILI